MRRSSCLTAGTAVVAALSLLVGCGSDPEPDPAEPLGAAEPAESPEPEADPAGTVLDLAEDPEGAVFDPVSGLLAVAVRSPTRLLLVDGQTGLVQTEVPLPGHARHLQLAAPGGPVLVPAEDSDRLIQVALPGGEITETPVGMYPHDAAQTAAGDIVVGDEMGGTLSVVRDGQVRATIEDLTQPGGVVTVGETAAVIDVADFTLTSYDVAAGQRVDRIPAGEGPTHLVADRDGRIFVVDTRGDALLGFGLDPLGETSRLDLPGAPYGLTYDTERDLVWVTLTGSNEVAGFDVSGAEPREVARFPTVIQPNTVATDPVSGRVYVLSRTGGQLQIITP